MTKPLVKPAFASALSKPSLNSLLDILKTEILLSINCHAIGTIQSFDATKQSATISMNYKREINHLLADYPVIIDCPVIVLTGGNSGITFPIKSGDTCLILFSDRDIDEWISSGQVTAPLTNRAHSFTDAIALVGLRSFSSPLENYSETKAVFFNEETKISLGTKIKLENTSTDLLTALEQLILLLDTFFTASSGALPPVGAAAAAAKASLAIFKTTLEGLLE